MTFKGLFAEKAGYFQLIIFLLLALSGIALANLLSFPLFLLGKGSIQETIQNPEIVRWIQLLSVICTFLLPALIGAWLFSRQPKRYLSLSSFPDFQLLLWVMLFMVLLSPAINLTALFNKQITLPSFMEGLEIWLQRTEAEAQRLTELLLSGEGAGVLLANLLVVAVAAGITEEFFFRGTLQRIFEKWTTNHHIVIWSVAFIFSAIHLQFYGLLPRMLLGAFFGYLLFWTKNIWIPVFAHFLNNAFGVVAMSKDEWKNNELISGDIPPDMLISYALWALLSLLLLYLCLEKFKQEIKTSSFPTNETNELI